MWLRGRATARNLLVVATHLPFFGFMVFEVSFYIISFFVDTFVGNLVILSRLVQHSKAHERCETAGVPFIWFVCSLRQQKGEDAQGFIPSITVCIAISDFDG